MDEKGQSEFTVILDKMRLIIQKRDDPQRNPIGKDQHGLHIDDENGHINEIARNALLEDIDKLLLMTKHAQEPEPPKTVLGFIKGALFSSAKKAQLFIPAQVSTSSTKGFAEVFTKILKESSIKCHIINNVSSLEEDLPLIVACPSGSRLEPSIDHALENFSWNTQFVAVILHFGTENSLPELESAHKLPLKDEYRNALFIDAAYNSDNRFYNCKMNETALGRIKMFIENFKK